MEPIPEAVAWAERADAWAQRPAESEQNPRWSDLASTGRPEFPAEGVGWRTETAEWRATEQTARWRQTTEWRSASGTHGWRSTTEAWQTGAGAEGFRPPVDPPTRQQLAISGTAWTTDDEQPVEATPSWQQPSADQPAGDAASWQRFTESPQPDNGRPAWQQFAAPPAPWQQGGPSAPWEAPRQQGGRSGSPRQADQPSWQQLVEPTSGMAAGAPPAWDTPAPPGRRDGASPPWESDPASRRPGWQSLAGPSGTDLPPRGGAADQPPHTFGARDEPAAFNGFISSNGSVPQGGANGSTPYRSSPYDGSNGPADGTSGYRGPNGSSPYGSADGTSGYGRSAPYGDDGTPGSGPSGYSSPTGAAPYGGANGSTPYGGANGAAPHDGGNGSAPYGGTNGSSPYGGAGGPSAFGGSTSANGSTPYGGANGATSYRGADGSAPYGGGSGASPYGGQDRDFGGRNGTPDSGRAWSGTDGSSPDGGGGASWNGSNGSAPQGRTGSAPYGGSSGAPYGGGDGAPYSGGSSAPYGGSSGAPHGEGDGAPYGGGSGSPYGGGAAYSGGPAFTGGGGAGGAAGGAAGAGYGGGGARGSYAETTTRSAPFDAGRHLVREDDRAQWRAQIEEQRPGRRRRAAEPGLKTSGGTGWSTRSDADHWAGHTDTGSMEVIDDAGVTDAPSWRSRGDSWRETVEQQEPEPDWRSTGDSWSAVPDSDNWNRGGRRRSTEDRQQISWQPADEEQNRRAAGQRSAPPAIGWQPAEDRDTPSWQRNGQPDDDDRPPTSWQRSAPAAIGWQPEDRNEPPTDDRDDRRPTSWQRGDRPDDDGRPTSWQRSIGPDDDDRRPPNSWQRSAPPAIGWQPDEDDRGSGRRGGGGPGRDTSSWRQDPRWQQEIDSSRDEDAPSRRRRDAEPADPWAQSAAETSVIPLPLYPDSDGRPGSGAVGRARPMNPNRRRDEADDRGPRPGDTSARMGATGFETRPDETGTRVGRRRAAADDDNAAGAAPIDPEVFRREPGTRSGDANWPAEEQEADWRRNLQGDGDAATEIRRPEPGGWQQDERDQAERGSASYRGGNTGDWRRELAAETSTNLADGESRRFGTEDFVPFKPVGSAAVPPSSPGPQGGSQAGPPAGSRATPPVSPAGPVQPREELLVGSTTGSRRPDVGGAADSQWPPRQSTGFQSAATGAYERRAVGGGLATAPSRSNNNLLEPDEDEIEEDTGGPLAAVGYTVIWYGVPVVLFVLYMLVLNGSQQAHALSTLAGAAPQFGLSLVLSMVVAVGLRWASGSWKAASVGLAAAVMGGGIATVLTSAITGNSLS